jgi:hypothetical protein
MAKGRNPLEIRKMSGDPIVTGDVRVTPVSWSLVGRWPLGGFVWSRPFALDVEEGGQIRRVPIVDVTRLVQVSLAALTLCSALSLMIRLRNRTR